MLYQGGLRTKNNIATCSVLATKVQITKWSNLHVLSICVRLTQSQLRANYQCTFIYCKVPLLRTLDNKFDTLLGLIRLVVSVHPYIHKT